MKSLVVTSFLLLCVVVCFGEQGDEVWRSVLEQGRVREKGGDLQGAAVLYEKVLELNPKAQLTAIRLGQVYEKLNRYDKALQVFQKARERNPLSYEASHALYLAARAAAKLADTKKANELIGQLEQDYPDSSYVARARLLKSEMMGESTATAARALDDELKAGKIYDEALAKLKSNDSAMVGSQLETIVKEYPKAAAALRARFSLGHLAVREERTTDALAIFSELLQEVAPKSPNSRLVAECMTRKAALLHKLRRREEAQEAYLALVRPDVPAMYSSNAILQSAGLQFELFQRRTQALQGAKWWGEKTTATLVTANEWNELRERLTEAEQLCVQPTEKARARLMIIETHLWENNPDAVPQAYEEFASRYNDDATTLEQVTAKHMLGVALMSRNKYTEAVDMFKQVLAVSPDKELWKDINMIQREYPYVALCLIWLDRYKEAEEYLAKGEKYFGPFLGYDNAREIMRARQNMRAGASQ